jgi:hypothetical protein
VHSAKVESPGENNCRTSSSTNLTDSSSQVLGLSGVRAGTRSRHF